MEGGEVGGGGWRGKVVGREGDEGKGERGILTMTMMVVVTTTPTTTTVL